MNHLNLKSGSDITPPLELPDYRQPCEQCEADTPTKVFFMKAGLGNACAVCGRLRRGKPYLSKAEFQTLKPESAKGGCHASTDS
jgi:hypothetical protein